MIDIRPDPNHPRGGFAVVTVEGLDPQDGQVMVAVLNSYQQKWLGPGGWQAGRAELPARSASWDGDRLTLVMGPDIVNHIEEDTPVRISIGDRDWDTYWPDDINQGPDEAVVGDLAGTGVTEQAKAPTIVKPPSPEAAPEPEPALDVALEATTATGSDGDAFEEDEAIEDEEEDTGRSMMPMALWAIAALTVIGVGAWLFLDTEPVQETAAADPPPAPTPAASPCAVATLQGVDGGFSALTERMRECSGELTADAALGLVERAAGSGDAEALRLFGTFYDETVTDPAIEEKIGLTFPDDPARAAEYYSRAVNAGSGEAEATLRSVCDRLAQRGDTLSLGAMEDYCS